MMQQDQRVICGVDARRHPQHVWAMGRHAARAKALLADGDVDGAADAVGLVDALAAEVREED